MNIRCVTELYNFSLETQRKKGLADQDTLRKYTHLFTSFSDD